MKHIRTTATLVALFIITSFSLQLPAPLISKPPTARAASVSASTKQGLALYNQGVVMNKQKNYAKAVTNFTKAVKLLKNNANLYYQLGTSYEGLKKYVVAASKYREAVKFNPRHSNAKAALKRLDRGPKVIVFTANW
ncbi:MAG TPA: hypothetical protein VGK02_06895 [Candidatus Aquicultor sp.]|jgi:tetratricopeptide (TPR) repeat protein